jgi:magnesium and cobalt exporter, CNNM family
MQPWLAGILWRLAGVLALVFANGFFVAAEFSIVTVRKTRIDQLIAEGHAGARAVRRALTAPDRYIAATQLGITMASLGLGWIGEPALASLLQPTVAFLPAHVAEATAHSLAVAVAFAVITSLHIVLGELAPKTIALERSEATALLVVKPTELFMKAFWPFIRLLNGTGQSVVNLLGMRGSGRHALVHSEQELKMLVTASQEAGVLEEQEEQMLHRVFGFADLAAGQVMVPRTELAAVAADTPRDALIEQMARGGYSRLPVYRQDLDDVIGILHATDVLKAMASGGGPVNAAALAREALTVPETLRADDVLAEMRRRGVREALVIDEYGGTAGLVTFESLMERIVGNLGSGFGSAKALINVLADGAAEIDGLVLAADVNEQFMLHIDLATYTTVGGYVLGRLGRRPRVGDTIEVEGRRMRVDALDGLRVAKVWLSKPTKTSTTEDTEEEQGAHGSS